ncbi:MAG: hypothetical protein WBF43_06735, partial [Methylocella sp.]
ILAGTALEKGASPGDLIKALGFPRAARDIEKYSPDQPRVPAGAGARAANGPRGTEQVDQAQLRRVDCRTTSTSNRSCRKS